MDAHLPRDADSTPIGWTQSLPTSCSLGTLSLSDECGQLSSGKKFPSTGTIPILLFDSDLLETDSASRFGMANNTRTENGSHHRVSIQDCCYSGVLLGLGVVESNCGFRGGSSGEGPESSSSSSSRAGLALDLVHGYHPPPSRSADDGNEDDREKDLFDLFFGPSSSSSSCSSCWHHPAASRSTSLSQVMQRARCGSSCGASPASINNTPPLIAAEKRKQNFALETCDLQISRPSSNSFHHYDCVEPLQLPLSSNHDHDQIACAVSSFSPTLSSDEADPAVDFATRNLRTMDNGFPPSLIEPSSSSSSSNSSIPPNLAWLQDVTISLCIDQEAFRTISPAFKLVGYTKPMLPIHSPRTGMHKLFSSSVGNNSNSPTTNRQRSERQPMDQTSIDPDLMMMGMAEFMPLKWESFVFHHSPLDPPPSIRRLSANGDESRDYFSQYAYLSIKSSGGGSQVYVVRGTETRRGGSGGGESEPGRSGGGGSSSSSPIKLEWRFEYAVEDKRKADGTKAGDGEKYLTPLRFSCSPGLLHPRQGRKVTVLSLWKKSIQPRVLANKLEPLIITSPTSPGNKVVSPLSSPTSPTKGVGAFRFPSASIKLWGKRTRTSPYRFDKGSDGSEEELIPSEDSSGNRRRRRPTSAYAPRKSRDGGAGEWPPQWWGNGDRGKSADAVWQQAGPPPPRDVRPATAGADGSSRGGRNRAESFGRGAASEGENERAMLARSQGGFSAPRYTRRPRTAR